MYLRYDYIEIMGLRETFKVKYNIRTIQKTGMIICC